MFQDCIEILKELDRITIDNQVIQQSNIIINQDIIQQNEKIIYEYVKENRNEQVVMQTRVSLLFSNGKYNIIELISQMKDKIENQRRKIKNKIEEIINLSLQQINSKIFIKKEDYEMQQPYDYNQIILIVKQLQQLDIEIENKEQVIEQLEQCQQIQQDKIILGKQLIKEYQEFLKLYSDNKRRNSKYHGINVMIKPFEVQISQIMEQIEQNFTWQIVDFDIKASKIINIFINMKQILQQIYNDYDNGILKNLDFIKQNNLILIEQDKYYYQFQQFEIYLSRIIRQHVQQNQNKVQEIFQYLGQIISTLFNYYKQYTQDMILQYTLDTLNIIFDEEKQQQFEQKLRNDQETIRQINIRQINIQELSLDQYWCLSLRYFISNVQDKIINSFKEQITNTVDLIKNLQILRQQNSNIIGYQVNYEIKEQNIQIQPDIRYDQEVQMFNNIIRNILYCNQCIPKFNSKNQQYQQIIINSIINKQERIKIDQDQDIQQSIVKYIIYDTQILKKVMSMLEIVKEQIKQREDYIISIQKDISIIKQKEYEINSLRFIKQQIQIYTQKNQIFQIGLQQIDLTNIYQYVINYLIKQQQQQILNAQQLFNNIIQDMISKISEVKRQLQQKIDNIQIIKQIMIQFNNFNLIQDQYKIDQINLKFIINVLNENSIDIKNYEQQFNILDKLFIETQQLSIQVQTQLKNIKPKLIQSLNEQTESLIIEYNQFISDYDNNGPQQVNLQIDQVNEKIIEFQQKSLQFNQKLTILQQNQQLLNQQVLQFEQIDIIDQELNEIEKIYKLYNSIQETIESYSQYNWQDIDFDDISKNVITIFQNQITYVPKQYYQIRIFKEMQKILEDFDTILPILQGLKQQYMKQRHWLRLYEILQKEQIKKFYNIEKYKPKVSDILDCDILTNIEYFQDILIASQKELQIEQKLYKIKELFALYKFQFQQYKDKGSILFDSNNTSQLVEDLSDNLMTIQSLRSSRYNRPFLSEIVQWYQILINTQEIVNLWLQVQQQWQYLDVVFNSPDISKQLEVESQLFQQVSEQYIQIMNLANQNPICIEITKDKIIKENLNQLIDKLEICQKSLSQYLERKRNLFPRFYFCSDSLLLEILGKQSDPQSIEPYLLNIFQNIAKLQFDNNKTKILSIYDKLGEKVELSEPVNIDGNIEEWLNNLLFQMKNTLRNMARHVCSNLNQQNIEQLITDLFNNQPFQITLLATQILWTSWCEQYFKKMDKKQLRETQEKIKRLMQALFNITRDKQLDQRQRIKIETLITLNVHQQDIFNEMIKIGSKNYVSSIHSFNWIKQMRYYWQPELDTIIVSIVDVDFEYQYEYIGIQDSLVITPLTDRCFITLTQALQQHLGGQPYGPAGTGKTETVKQLAKQLGIYCVIFNCSEQMNYRSIGSIFKGVAQSGCFVDFDEFNRIQLNVMSVAAQQLNCILSAMRNGKQQVKYTDGSIINIQKQCGFFITMNPGYSGRVELLQNLKTLFRSVAMVCHKLNYNFQVFLIIFKVSKLSILFMFFYYYFKILCKYHNMPQIITSMVLQVFYFQIFYNSTLLSFIMLFYQQYQMTSQPQQFPEIPVDRYKIVQSIGRGAFSRCYLALSPEFKASCIKRIRMTSKPHTLLKEIEFLRHLSGKENIVQIKEVRFSESNLQVSVITNYMDGDDFKNTILDYTPKDIQKYMKCLLTALSQIENTALHRDVKPGNFLFNRATGKGMLIDFGLAQSIKEAREFPLQKVVRKGLQNDNENWNDKLKRWCDDFKQYGNALAGPVAQNQNQRDLRQLPSQPHSGTHGYRAPEILLPCKNQSTKIDAWSAGVILLQLVTGKTSIFRGQPNTDIYELLAIRSIIGTDRFTQQCGLMGIDFTLTPGVPTPSNISYEELCQWYNPDLFAVLPQSCFQLLRGLLEFRPERRWSASQALKCEFLTTENLPDFRYQDGAAHYPLSAFAETSVQAAKDRQKLIGQQLGFNDQTMQTVVQEYSKMQPQQMISLSKDIRKAAEQAVKKYKMDQNTILPNGLIVQRAPANEYIFPQNSALQDLESGTQVEIVRPKLARTKVDWESYWSQEKKLEWKIMDQVVEEYKNTQNIVNMQTLYDLVQQEINKKQAEKIDIDKITNKLHNTYISNLQYFMDQMKQMEIKTLTQQFYEQYRDDLPTAVRYCLYKTFEGTQKESLQNYFEIANQYKEEYERTIRQTAYRRRVDQWIQPLKALDKELQEQQRIVRATAEKWRNIVAQKVKQQEEYELKTQNIQSECQQSQVKQTETKVYSEIQDQEEIIQEEVDYKKKTRKEELLDELQQLYKDQAKLVSLQHRVSLTGPTAWNSQSYKHYQQNIAVSNKEQNFIDCQQKAYQSSRQISILALTLQNIQTEIDQLKVKISKFEQQHAEIVQKIEFAQGAEKYELMIRKQQIEQLLKEKNEKLKQNMDKLQQQQIDYEQQKADAQANMNQYKQNVNQFLHEEPSDNDQPVLAPDQITDDPSTDDEQSEIRPDVPIYDPDELQEVYYKTSDQIKQLMQESEQLQSQRHKKRMEIRNNEYIKNKKYDLGVKRSIKAVNDIIKCREELIQEVEREMQEKQQQPQIEEDTDKQKEIKSFSELVTLYQVYCRYHKTQEVLSFTEFCKQNNYQYQNVIYPESEDVAKHRQALFDLLTSPQGRYYLCFHRIFQQNSTNVQVTESNLLNLLFKQNIYIPDKLKQSYKELQNLTLQYIKSEAGKKDLLLVAAAVQSELDYQCSQIKDPELVELGLSKRPQNLGYILQISQLLNPLIAPLDQNQQRQQLTHSTRSTSAIAGLTKSATHRSLVDPGRTLQRYPQTAKYIQTMLDQTLRKYLCKFGVLNEIQEEIDSGIKAIKARMWEIGVEEMYQKSTDEQRIEIGRIRDMIQQVGAEIVYDICVGIDKVEWIENSVLNNTTEEIEQQIQKKAQFLTITEADVERIQKGDLDDMIILKLQVEAQRNRDMNNSNNEDILENQKSE